MAGKADSHGGSGSCQSNLRSSCCSNPAWLVTTLADLDQRIRTLALNSQDDKDQDQAETFAERAESYYQQRPKLLSLLQDLYKAYLSLADRHCQSHHKHHHYPNNHNYGGASSSSEHLSCSSVHHNFSDYQSDAESSLSYQLPSATVPIIYQNDLHDEIISELVIKNVEYDLMVHELGIKERRSHESLRKIELQRSLLEVLESERLILLNENAGLRYKVGALVEENKGLASESMFMKRKAGELARSVLKMRDDHRVCMLTHKNEDLQGKIYVLEKKNCEYYQQLVKQEKTLCPSCNKSKDVVEVTTEACFQGDKERGIHKKGVRISKWWDKVKNSDLLFLCKPYPSKNVGC